MQSTSYMKYYSVTNGALFFSRNSLLLYHRLLLAIRQYRHRTCYRSVCVFVYVRFGWGGSKGSHISTERSD